MAFKLDALGKECTVNTVTENSSASDVLSKELQGMIPKELNPSWPRWLRNVYLENVNPDRGITGSEIFWLLFISVSDAIEKGEEN